MLFKITSGNKWYIGVHGFSVEEDLGAIFKSLKSAEKTIRTNIKTAEQRTLDWQHLDGNHWWEDDLKIWREAKVVAYKLVRIDDLSKGTE